MAIEYKKLHYNALDSAVTLACRNSIRQELLRTGYIETYEMSQRLMPVIFYMTCRGIQVDSEALANERVRVSIQIEEKQKELNECVGRDLNVNSSAACQQYFYIELGIQPYTKTTVGSDGQKLQTITTDDKAMARLARGTASRAPIQAARLVQELRRLKKLRGTYLEVLFDSDNRLRCSINPRGTRFGRLSTSQTIFGTGTNMQNLPESFKNFLIADPGHLFYEMDKARAEWVVVAYVSGDAGMIDVCESGLDPHVHTAFQMYGAPKDIIELEAKELGHVTDPEQLKEWRSKFEQILNINTKSWPRTMTMRQAGKKSNHGLNYDETYKTFALQNDMQEREAKEMINLYHGGYPGVRHWHGATKEQLRHDRTLINCFGRKYKFLDRWGDDLFKAAYAFIPQSTVADLLNNGLIKTFHSTESCLDDTEIMMQVHDSGLFQRHNPTNFKMWAQAILKQQAYLTPTLTYSGRDFQIGTDLKIGNCWGKMIEVKIGDNETELADRLEETVREYSLL